MNAYADTLAAELFNRASESGSAIFELATMHRLEDVQQEQDRLSRQIDALAPLPGRNPVPLQKPLRTKHFTGRADELKKLLADLQPGRAVTLCGPGGMGKSALAAEAIWTLAPGDDPPERFPDGIIFHTFYHQPQAGLALEKIARAYGVDPHPSPRDAALQALAGKTALIVLDGTEAANDLKVVLGVTGGCGVLITTQKLRQAPDVWQDIKPLPDGESLDLVRAWAGSYAADDAAANEIVQLLGGLPLALFLAGRYMEQLKKSAGKFAQRLRQAGLDALSFGKRPSESIPLLMQLSLEQVSARARAGFGLAGVLAFAPFKPDVIAAVLELAPTVAEDALDELVNFGLLSSTDESYQVTHALAHSYARTKAAPDAEIISRLAMYYAAVAEAESTRGVPGYAVLDLQRAHILAVQTAALHARQWDAVLHVTSNLTKYLDVQGYWSELVSTAQAGLDAARATSNRHDEIAFLNTLGNVYYRFGEAHRAIKLYEQALIVARAIGDGGTEGVLLNNLGIVYAAQGEVNNAIDMHEQAQAIALDAGDRLKQANALGALANCHLRSGEAHRAIELYKQVLAIARELHDRQVQGVTLGNLGNAYFKLGDANRALDFYRELLLVARETGDRSDEAAALGNLGSAHLQLGEVRRAVELYEQQREIVIEIGEHGREEIIDRNLKLAYAVLGELRRAVEQHEHQLAIALASGDRRGMVTALEFLSVAYGGLDEPRRVIEISKQYLVVSRELGNRDGEGAALNNLAAAYTAINDSANAIEISEQYLVIARKRGDQRGEANALGSLGTAYANLGETRRAVELYQQALPILEETQSPNADVVRSNLIRLLSILSDPITELLKQWPSVRSAVIAACQGSTIAITQLQPVLAYLEEMSDWRAMAAATRRLLNGERNHVNLIHGLDDTDADFIASVLQMLG